MTRQMHSSETEPLDADVFSNGDEKFSPTFAHGNGFGSSADELLLDEKKNIFERGIGTLGSAFSSGGLPSLFITMIKMTLGGGLIGIPYALQHAGWCTFNVVLVLTCVYTIYSLYVICILHEKTGLSTYQVLARSLYGPWLEHTVSVFMIILCWGAGVMYLIAIGGVLEPVQNFSNTPEVLQGRWGRNMLVTLFWGVFILPLCLPLQINSLRYASLAGVLSAVILVVFVIIFASNDHRTTMANVPAFEWNLGTIVSLPVAMFSYGPQSNAFGMYTELQPRYRNPITMPLVSGIALALCTVLYAVCGMVGAANFGSSLKPNILNNYNPLKTKYMVVPFIGMAITLLMTFPVYMFPARNAVLNFIGFPCIDKTPTHIRLGISGLLATSALILSLFVPQITVMFGICGGICGSFIFFVFPSMFILATKEWSCAKVGIIHVALVWSMLILGAIVGVFSTAVTLYTTIKG